MKFVNTSVALLTNPVNLAQPKTAMVAIKIQYFLTSILFSNRSFGFVEIINLRYKSLVPYQNMFLVAFQISIHSDGWIVDRK